MAMFDRFRWLGLQMLAVVVTVACLTAGCGSSSSSVSSHSTSTAGTSQAQSVVALGDSVPSGYGCECTPYPELTATGLEASAGKTVTATNDAIAGYTTSDVLRQLDSDSAVIDQVKKAGVVELNVGANDVPYNAHGCGTSVDCYAPLLGPMTNNLVKVVDRLHRLTGGHAIVELLDYWSVWLGGTYARDKGHAYVTAARKITDEVDSAIKTTANQSDSGYVSVRRAFKGPSFGYVESYYLASDGEHPNAAGHQAIAVAAEAAIESSPTRG